MKAFTYERANSLAQAAAGLGETWRPTHRGRNKSAGFDEAAGRDAEPSRRHQSSSVG